VLAAAGASLVPFAASADAASTVGQTFIPPASNCGANTFLQSASLGNAYTVPSDGVITSWSFQASAAPPTLRFKLARPAGGNNFTIIGESDVTTPTASTVSAFPIRISAHAGDVIGFRIAAIGHCGMNGTTNTLAGVTGDPPVGSTTAYVTGPGQLDVAATLEADADADGFGDETQDACPADTAVQALPCPVKPLPEPLETTITSGPKKKTDSPTAKFSFTSSVAGSSFQCMLKGRGLDIAIKQFTPCTSPRKYRELDRGKYTFLVFATGVDGNADATPAKLKFKVTQ
jgi:hypothetical protein